jgi:hypothetical protein
VWLAAHVSLISHRSFAAAVECIGVHRSRCRVNVGQGCVAWLRSRVADSGRCAREVLHACVWCVVTCGMPVEASRCGRVGDVEHVCVKARDAVAAAAAQRRCCRWLASGSTR